jgi:hypothetical protein
LAIEVPWVVVCILEETRFGGLELPLYKYGILEDLGCLDHFKLVQLKNRHRGLRFLLSLNNDLSVEFVEWVPLKSETHVFFIHRMPKLTLE